MAHWFDFPSIPVAESDLIAVGSILAAQSHISNDRVVIYSEFSVRIDEVLEGDNAAIHTVIPATRHGGLVLYPSGRLDYFRFFQQGFPLVGRDYVLFLKKQVEGDFHIITAYELREGVAVPVDGMRAEGGGGRTQFDDWDGVPSDKLLASTKQRILGKSKRSIK